MTEKNLPFFESGFKPVNGLDMYYEIHGEGQPLVLIHGGGSTIDTTFGRIIPRLSAYFKLIAVELQAHGHTRDRSQPLSFQQDADDIAELLKQLDIAKADFLGFSNGGQTLFEIAFRYPELINKMILASTFYSREAVDPAFWKAFEGARVEMMPTALAEGYLAANNDKAGLQTMFERDVERMKNFKGWSADQIRSISAPALVINGCRDVAPPEHAVEMYRLIPNCQLAIFPGGHGEYLGTIESVADGKLPNFNAAELVLAFLSD
jgi:pimeloyl-ACP methyl ester carboxylesterase